MSRRLRPGEQPAWFKAYMRRLDRMLESPLVQALVADAGRRREDGTYTVDSGSTQYYFGAGRRRKKAA